MLSRQLREIAGLLEKKSIAPAELPETPFKVQCKMCKQMFDLPVTQKQFEDWKSGTLIQRAMPNLKPDQRELLISGTCGKCWDRLFKK